MVNLLILLIILLLKVVFSRDSLVTMASQKDSVVDNPGILFELCLAKVPFPGYALGILMICVIEMRRMEVCTTCITDARF